MDWHLRDLAPLAAWLTIAVCVAVLLWLAASMVSLRRAVTRKR